MSLYIGIDSGTQSTKAVVLDLEQKKVIAEARAPHQLIGGLPVGHMEQHPQDWTDAMDTVIQKVVALVDASRIRGIGVSGQQHGFVPLDEKGLVIRPAKLWCDTSTVKECELLTKKFGGDKNVIKKAGLKFLPGFTAPKILWLKRNEPANFKRLRHVLLPHDYLNFHLTGNYFMEYGDASGTALLDVRKRTWSKEAVTASFGTSGTIYAYAKSPVVDPQGEIAAFCSSTDGWMPLLCTMNVTTVTEHFRRMFNLEPRAFDELAATAPAGAGGLVLLPYLEGERTPNVPLGSGAFLGLNGKNIQPAYLARAAMEGVTMGMNYGLRRLADLGVKAKEIRVTGGGAKSPVWRQLMADVFGTPVVGMVEDEGAALGGALQAAWALARRDSRKAKITDFTTGIVALNESTRCLPQKANVARYRELQALQDKLSTTLREVFPQQRKLANA